VELVTVDVTVVDADGEPVADLTAGQNLSRFHLHCVEPGLP
jgi:hypothetical protein